MKGFGKYLAGVLTGLHLGIDALLIFVVCAQQDRINALERRPIGHKRYSTPKRYTSYAEMTRENNKERDWCRDCKHRDGSGLEEPCASCFYDSLGYRTNYEEMEDE